MSNDNRDFVKRSQLKFADCNEGEPGALMCPCCGSSYMHHDFVDFYERQCEDGPSHLVRVKAAKEDSINLYSWDHPGKNPSRRRDGIRIYFWCEDCDASVHLTIAQHKGCSFLEMEHVEHGRFLER
jgi:Zn finger protein HypA/HybF involved in hydrogenase expression